MINHSVLSHIPFYTEKGNLKWNYAQEKFKWLSQTKLKFKITIMKTQDTPTTLDTAIIELCSFFYFGLRMQVRAKYTSNTNFWVFHSLPVLLIWVIIMDCTLSAAVVAGITGSALCVVVQTGLVTVCTLWAEVLHGFLSSLRAVGPRGTSWGYRHAPITPVSVSVVTRQGHIWCIKYFVVSYNVMHIFNQL